MLYLPKASEATRRSAIGLFGSALVTACLPSRIAGSEGVKLDYLVPAASDTQLGLKVWLSGNDGAPILTIDGKSVVAEPIGTDLDVWTFQQNGLQPGTPYQLDLRDSKGQRLTSPWALSTSPDPRSSSPQSVRLLVFTCAGGDPAQKGRGDKTTFLPMDARRRLLEKGLSYNPDLVIANGDHVYWDQLSLLKRRQSDYVDSIKSFYAAIAPFDETQSVTSAQNSASLRTVIRRQICSVYGDLLKSTPTVFIADDHDYFENDLVGDWGATFPPRRFVRDLQIATRDLAYPHSFDNWTPSNARDTVQSIRWGKLLQCLTYDCRLHLKREPVAQFLSEEAERFVLEETKSSDASALFHIPSTPFGWSAGKWAEWYEDRGRGVGNYGDDKDFWAPGWFDQHQRLTSALSGQDKRVAMALGGDLHASGALAIKSSGDADFSRNPVHSILCGPLGSGDLGFPSTARGDPPFVPSALTTSAVAELQERNGFALIDVTKDQARFRLFNWRPPETIAMIDGIEPRADFTLDTSL